MQIILSLVAGNGSKNVLCSIQHLTSVVAFYYNSENMLEMAHKNLWTV